MTSPRRVPALHSGDAPSEAARAPVGGRFEGARPRIVAAGALRVDARDEGRSNGAHDSFRVEGSQSAESVVSAQAVASSDRPSSVAWPCRECGRGFVLMVMVHGEYVCPGCVQRLKLTPDDIAPAHELEIATRERMQARGGTHRHLVRKGLT